MVADFILQKATSLALRPTDTQKINWTNNKVAIRQDLIKALGLQNIPKVNKLTLIDTIDKEDHIIEKIVYEATPGLLVPALFYIPKSPGPHPAVVHPPGHWMEDSKLASSIQQFNLRLVRSGIATFCYDTLGQGERRIGWHQHGQLAPLLVGFTSLGLMVRDTLTALDIIESRQNIDSTRLGVVGASGGAFSSIFTSVIDERIQVAAISSMVNTHLSQIRDAAFGTGWDSWVDLCNQVPGLSTIANMGEILACIAPRKLLVANAKEDPSFPLTGAREVAAEIRLLLDHDKTSETFTYLEVPGGHGFDSPHMRTAVADFLTNELVGKKKAADELQEISFNPQWTVPHNQGTAERPQSTVAIPSEGTCLPEPVDSNLPVLVLAKERANMLRRERSQLDQSKLKMVLGPFPDSTATTVTVTNHLSFQDYHVQRLSLNTEPGITIDALLILPENWSDTPPPVLIMLDEGGKVQALKSAVVEHARNQGWAVLLPDLRGTGESATSEFEVASAAWMLDRDLLNQRTWDTLCLVNFLSSRYSTGQQIDKGKIFIWGEDAFGLIALLATALDKRISGVVVDGIVSLEDALVLNSNVTPMLYHFNLLETLDLADLQELIYPRPAHIRTRESKPSQILDSLFMYYQ